MVKQRESEGGEGAPGEGPLVKGNRMSEDMSVCGKGQPAQHGWRG